MVVVGVGWRDRQEGWDSAGRGGAGPEIVAFGVVFAAEVRIDADGPFRRWIRLALSYPPEGGA